MVSRLDSQGVKERKSESSRRELSNVYLVAKLGLSCARIPLSLFFSGKDRTNLLACVDTAENEPLEVWGKVIQYYSFVSLLAAAVAKTVPSAPFCRRLLGETTDGVSVGTT